MTKRIILVMAVALLLAFVGVDVASANGGPHGGYTATTDACAGCHRAHTAVGPKLLVQATTYDLCISCHGSAGAGANTNVEDGFYLETRDDTAANGNVGDANTATNGPLLGGGFVNYKGVAVTSSHSVTGTTTAAWGNGVNRGITAALSEGLSCAGCHDPHGSGNYRIIKSTVNGQTVSVAQVDEGAAKDYDDEDWGAGTSSFCAACHSEYHVTTAGSGSDPAMVGSGGFAHRVDVTWNDNSGATYVGVGTTNPETGWLDPVGGGTHYLPLAESGTNDMLVCMTCHLPHGTSAQAVGFASGTFDPTGPLGPVAAGDSSLLRLDNRGVCEVCHQK